MAHSKRMSISSVRSVSPIAPVYVATPETEQWVKTWQSVPAKGVS